jgi:hypothetical protein
MADHLLFIGWDEVVRGREERAQEVFNETVGLYGRYQQEGRIESFDATFLSPNASGLQGYFQLFGTLAQLHAIEDDTDFQRAMATASMIVDDMRVIHGATGSAIAEQMEIFAAAAATVPQTH